MNVHSRRPQAGNRHTAAARLAKLYISPPARRTCACGARNPARSSCSEPRCGSMTRRPYTETTSRSTSPLPPLRESWLAAARARILSGPRHQGEETATSPARTSRACPRSASAPRPRRRAGHPIRFARRDHHEEMIYVAHRENLGRSSVRARPTHRHGESSARRFPNS